MSDRRLSWKQAWGTQVYTATLRDRSRYIIFRTTSDWSISYLPTGNAQDGRVSVPWDSDEHTLNNAKISCAIHLAQGASERNPE